MAQFLRPDSDIANTWTGTFADIDEAIALDADRVYSANNPNGSGAEFGLSNPSGTPGSGTVTVRYRYAQVNNGTLSGTGTATSLVVELLEGATVRGTSATHSPSGSYVAGSFTVDASTITNWNDLRIKFAASGGSGSPSNRRGVAVSWAEVEAPDAPSGVPGNASQSALLTIAVSAFTATASAPQGLLISDDFERSTSNGWGTADTGGAWSAPDQNAAWWSTDGEGKITAQNTLPTNSVVNDTVINAVESYGLIRWGMTSLSGTHEYQFQTYLRRAADTGSQAQYAFVVVIPTDGVTAMQMNILRRPNGGAEVSVTGGEVSIPGKAYVAGERWWLRYEAVGTNPTVLRMRVWKDGEAEPGTWDLTYSDNDADQITTGGTTGVQVYGDGSAGYPTTYAFKGLRLRDDSAPAVPDLSGGNGSVTAALQSLAVSVLDATATGDPVLYPQVADVVQSYDFGSVTTGNCTLPSGIEAGDLILVFVARDGGGAVSWPGAWQALLSNDEQAVVSGYMAYLIASGGETSVAPTYQVAERANYVAVRITNWHGTSTPSANEVVLGASAAPDSGSLTAPWGSEANLWFSFVFHDGTGGPWTPPSGYTLIGSSTTTEITSAGNIAVATKEATTDTEDPGAFDATTSDSWGAWTIVVRPAAAPAGGGGTANASLQTLTGSLFASTPSGAADTTAALQSFASSLMAAVTSGKGQGTAGLQSIAAGDFAHSAIGMADVSAALQLLATSALASSASGKAQTTASLQSIASSLFAASATGGGGVDGPIPTYVASGAGSGNSTAAIPAHSAGDLLILSVSRSGGTASAPSGWTLVPDSHVAYTGAHQVRYTYLFYKYGDGVETSVTVSGAEETFTRVHVFTGAHETSPFEGVATQSNTAAPLTHADLTTLGNNRRAVCFQFHQSDNVFDWSLTGATGGTWAELAFFGTGAGWNHVENVSDAEMASAGTISGGSASGVNVWGSIVLAIKPITTGGGGGVTANAALQIIGSSLMAHAAAGKAAITSGLLGAASASFAAGATGKAQTTAAILSVPASLLGGTASGAADTSVPLLVTVNSAFDAAAVGEAIASTGLQAIGITPFAATAGVLVRVTAALQSLTGSVLTVDPAGAAEAAAVLQSVGMTLFSANVGGTATHDAALLLVSGSVLASAAQGGGNVQPDLLAASVAVLSALAAGSALANASQVSANLSIFQPSVNGGSSTTANADLLSLNVSTLDPTVSAGSEVTAALLSAAWSIHSASVGGGAAGQANADMLLMALSQMAGQAAGSAMVVPGLLGSNINTLAAQVSAGATVSPDMQQAGWSPFAATAGGASSAIANAALLIVGLVLQSAGASGAGLGVAGIASLVSDALDAAATGAGHTEAGISSVSVTVLNAWAGETVANFVGTVSNSLSLVGKSSVSLSLVGTESAEVAA